MKQAQLSPSGYPGPVPTGEKVVAPIAGPDHPVRRVRQVRPVRLVRLPADGTVLRLRVRGPQRLRVLSGRAWVTRDRCPHDHWIDPAQTLDLPRHEAGDGWLSRLANVLWGRRISVGADGAAEVTLKVESLAGQR